LLFDHLQIYDQRERTLVGTADLMLRAVAPVLRVARRAPHVPPRRILLLRLERIGDLLMSLDAIADVRQAAPGATIDLVVGSWNAGLARCIPGIDHLETLDPAWLARDEARAGLAAALRQARSWSARQYDLAINFEPDIRSNMLLALSRAARTVGYRTAGGGALLDIALRYDPTTHTTDNARRLVAAVLDVPPRAAAARLEISADLRERALDILVHPGPLTPRSTRQAPRPLIGVHASGGRAIKQWDLDRFAEIATRAIRTHGATIVLTGSAADRTLVDTVKRDLPAARVIDVAGALDLPALAAVLGELDLLVTGDTGPMHLAAAVGTPVVAVFGPSDPNRYAPRDAMHHIVRVDLPCSPCNRIRLPPERCTGHTPDCLTGVDIEMVCRAIDKALERTRPAARLGAARG
jgi:ADP-heptose:LPS heptosyltransferase